MIRSGSCSKCGKWVRSFAPNHNSKEKKDLYERNKLREMKLCNACYGKFVHSKKMKEIKKRRIKNEVL